MNSKLICLFYRMREIRKSFIMLFFIVLFAVILWSGTPFISKLFAFFSQMSTTRKFYFLILLMFLLVMALKPIIPFVRQTLDVLGKMNAIQKAVILISLVLFSAGVLWLIMPLISGLFSFFSHMSTSRKMFLLLLLVFMLAFDLRSIIQIFNQMSPSRKIFFLLFLVFLLAIGLRSIMPLFLAYYHETDPFSLMLASKHRYLWEVANEVALGNYEFSTAITAYTIINAVLISISTFFFNSASGLFFIQFFQGFIDSFGCLLVFGILGIYYNNWVRLLGALIYAIWLPSIFYSYHLLDEAYIPVLILLIGYMIMKYIKNQRIIWLILAGIFSGVLFSMRIDNLLLLLFLAVYIVWLFREKLLFAMAKGFLLLLLGIVSLILINTTIKKTFTIESTLTRSYPAVLSATFFNALGEYPATYNGMRFFDNDAASRYAQKKLKIGQEQPVHKESYAIKIIREKAPEFSVYVQEVILEKPFLYADWLIRRFFVYLPSHPYFATVIYFFSSPTKNDWWTMKNYRFSQMFHGVKYFDYLLFGLVTFGVWKCRNNKGMMVFFWMYMGVLVGHVFTQCGEIYFREDLEEVYLNPKYLLGMISIYPIFLSVVFERKVLKTGMEKFRKGYETV